MNKTTVDQILAYMPNKTIQDKIARISFLQAAKAAQEAKIASLAADIAKLQIAKARLGR